MDDWMDVEGKDQTNDASRIMSEFTHFRPKPRLNRLRI
jgi:hypothetical protein